MRLKNIYISVDATKSVTEHYVYRNAKRKKPPIFGFFLLAFQIMEINGSWHVCRLFTEVCDESAGVVPNHLVGYLSAKWWISDDCGDVRRIGRRYCKCSGQTNESRGQCDLNTLTPWWYINSIVLWIFSSKKNFPFQLSFIVIFFS